MREVCGVAVLAVLSHRSISEGKGRGSCSRAASSGISGGKKRSEIPGRRALLAASDGPGHDERMLTIPRRLAMTCSKTPAFLERTPDGAALRGGR